uniref:NAD-dependent epimerase/dehydratase family protein n=1 Tax=unclassified Variovorax TaxID=663243 RepID=UPI000D384D39
MNFSIAGSKVLVLGGRGFLGRHLCPLLVEQGASVRIFGRHPPTEADLDYFGPGVEFVQGDLTEGRGLLDALQGVDLVYHLISTTVPSGSNADPIGDVHSNLVGTLRLLDVMRCAGVRRIVYGSSGGTVYGNPQALPVDESHPLQPISSYGVVKVAIENYLRIQSDLTGLTANVLRISNPYGMHQTRIGSQGLIATFVARLMRGEPIEIWGDGSTVRDYVYVHDVARALLLAGQRTQSGTFNIGSGVGHSVNEVLAQVLRHTRLSGDVRYLPKRGFDVQNTFLDIGRARNELGWKPQYTLEQGCALYCQLVGAGMRESALR